VQRGSGSGDLKPVVTLAALYGAGGSIIGPRVAEQLGVPFLDRQIPDAVARETGLPEGAVEDVDEEPRTGVERLISTLGRASTIGGGGAGSLERLDLHERRIRAYIERFIARTSVSGGVILGRGGMVVLRGSPVALHVYLQGSPEARLRRAMEISGVDRATARRRQRIEDDARRGYVRRAYGVDGEDPGLYHVILDSTELNPDSCVALILAASRARIEMAASAGGAG
jgi:cytidylate kinase